MRNRERAVLAGFFILLAVKLSLAPQVRAKVDTRRAQRAGSTAGATGIVGPSLSGSGKSTGQALQAVRLPLGSPPAVKAGGTAAGKAKTGIGSKPPRIPGVPTEVLEAAATGLPFFLGQIPPGSQQLYGFSAVDDLSRAQLGGALRMHTITPVSLESSSSSTPVSSIKSETSMWFFPVLLDGESKAMLVVDREGEAWKAVSLGYAGLGHEWNGLLAQWPESKGFHPQLVAVFQARQFYFTVPEIDDFNLTQLTLPQGELLQSGTAAHANNYSKLTVLSQSLQELKPIVLTATTHPMR
jgi:hypothetical protein